MLFDSDSHHRHKKQKHQRRHRSSNATSLLKSICDETQSISKQVMQIEGLTTDRPVHDAQRAESYQDIKV